MFNFFRLLKHVLVSSWKNEDLITLFCDKGQVICLASDQIVTSRTLEGIYPNYKQLIPDSFSKSIIIDRKMFVSALERIAVLADQLDLQPDSTQMIQ